MYSPPPLPPGGVAFPAFLTERWDFFLFVDACIRYPRVSGGAILKDSLGVVIWTNNTVFNFESRDSTLAELQALLFGLSLLAPKKPCTLWVGLDSYQALEHFKKRSDRYIEQVKLIELHTRKFEQVMFQNIERRHNKEADILAAGALP